MKNVLMIFVLLGGFALQQVGAQKGCQPCPPGCCVLSCSASAKGSAASSSAATQPDLIFASFNPDGNNPSCQKMNKKEMKACLASCHGAPGDGTHTADAVFSADASSDVAPVSTPACQPGCKVSAACKPATTSASADLTPQSRQKEKG
jgi:hypothetical protein